MTTPAERWQRIKAILDQALQTDVAGREDVLARACDGDSELQRDVEAMLRQQAAADRLLETACVNVERADDLVGRQIDSYVIERRIGAGGMGEVYLATDRKLQRQVALKLLSSRLSEDADRLRRFRQEARAASSLNHPHILVIHDFGEIDRRPFIVSEFVEGKTLRHVLDEGPLHVAQAVAIAAQITSALAAAHARNIVHRDVKPENIMVRPDGYVKVLDFGLAKLSPAEQVDDVHTLPGMLMGTPRYMSPEQARGLETDARTDVWSVGVVLYEMLAGRAPFNAATPADTIATILNTEPLALDALRPDLSTSLSKIVSRALQKNRFERYSNAAEMAADVSAAEKHLTTINSRSTPARSAGVTSGTPVSTPSARNLKRTRVIVLPLRMLRPDPEVDFLSFSLADAISTTLSSLDSLIVRSSMSATRFAADALDVKAIAAEAQVDVVLTGTLLRSGSQLRASAQLLSAPEGTILWSDRLDVSLDDIFKIQDALAEKIVDALAVPFTAREQESLRRDVPASAEAYELYLRGNTHFYHPDDWTIARELYLECVSRDAQFAPAWARLGRCYRLTAKFRARHVAETNSYLQKADAAFQRAFEINPDLPIAHHLYTALETDLGRAEEAMLRLVRRARQRRADPELYAGLVHACRYCGLLEASLNAHERARELDPNIVTTVAQTHWMNGDFEAAVPGFVGHSGYFLGLPYVSLGRFDDALAAAQSSRASDATTRSYQSILPMVIAGRTAECLALLDDLAPRNPDPESVFYIARTYSHLGAVDRALQQLARAVDMGFFCVPAFERDVWLENLRREPAFADVMTRARARHHSAAQKFNDAGGARLLGTAS